MNTPRPLVRLMLAALTLSGSAAQADITIGVSLPLTGAASSLGIPMANQIKLFPEQIGGEKLKIVIADDATDPAKGAQNAKRFTEEGADLVVGSVVTPIAAAMAQHLNEAQVPQYALGPFANLPGKDGWSFRMVHAPELMAQAVMAHLRKSGVKTLGFLGYADAYGEGWLTEMNKLLAQPGAPTLVAVERFARTDSSVAAQALKLASTTPDAILVVASGGGAALPQRALAERAYKGRIYQTHAAASRDFLRLAGKDAEGAYVVAAPGIVPEQLPAGHVSKPLAQDFVKGYEGAYGAGTRAIYSASVYDVQLVLQMVIPKALKLGKPGTPAFRTALRDLTEQLGPQPVANGVLNFSKDNHWAYGPASPVMLRVAGGDWKVD
ncbi:ABC transporter substrate-binding protein [Ideonella sp. 4Y11]|uniref:ABC transporter substrate-binding protein n=1 Tax=Ideonella aquatica TaxID=2824119 RepID=A0A940YGQ6_9BURK|nr:ABC transporter substrate-binding protein [Ideonella aquatica]MBQ0959810.1 ABC transporter substrate-binding protein [Ideonella aquatica]